MKFNKDGKFKIMQITDIQEIYNVSNDTLKLLEAAVEKEKPDLVIYTGDQIKGYGVTYKGMGNELVNNVSYKLNDGDLRTLAIVKKISQTPTQYPRKPKKISTKPL